MKQHEPMLDQVSGDIGLSRYLGKALDTLVANPNIDKDLKAQLQEILQGKGTLRDLAHSESFRRMSDSLMPHAITDHQSTSPEQRQQMAELGESLFAQCRSEAQQPVAPTEQAPPAEPPRPAPAQPPIETTAATNRVIPGTRKPNRDRVVGPSDEDDEDDRYFQDRNRGGWIR